MRLVFKCARYLKPLMLGGIGLVLFFSVFAVSRVSVGLFSAGDLSGWREKSFKGKTQYRLKQEGDILILVANSQAAASGLIKKQSIDLLQTPILHWRWRMTRLPGTTADERSRQGDDYAARIYLIKSGGVVFWRSKAINYVWSANQIKGSVWENAFAGKNAMMVAVRGKGDPVGGWMEERRNVFEDFKQLYGEEISTLDAVAIMTDTDNAGGHAIAEYGDIYFSSD
jgi:hypothetical protein